LSCALDSVNGPQPRGFAIWLVQGRRKEGPALGCHAMVAKPRYAKSPVVEETCKGKRQALEAEGEREPREERMENRSIDVGLSGLDLLTRDPRAADLLISMAASAVRCNDESRKELLVQTIPPEFQTPNGMKDWNALASTIDKLPALAEVPSACRLSEWLASIDGRLPCCLEWILGSYCGQLQEITLEPGLLDPDWTVFLVKPSSLGAVRTFEERKRSAEGSFFAFHASPFFNWHSILRTNIRILSGTKFAAHGASLGNGIYLASSASTILSYLRPGSTWRNSTFGQACFGLCEVVRDKRFFTGNAGMVVVKEEANVMLRCLCVCTRPMNEVPLLKASDMAALISNTDSYRTFFG
jgi:Poly(ADP-ribose) polymerase catalytic domain/ARTD15 N-terminal domain